MFYKLKNLCCEPAKDVTEYDPARQEILTQLCYKNI